jgi:hypothetical protein
MAHPLHSFITAARAKGADDAFVARVLVDAGWPEDQVYDAYLQSYVELTGMPVPAPLAGRRISARDAFYYLVSFLTLGIWAFALGSMIYVFINRALPDPQLGYYYEPSVSSQLAAIIIALPVYLWMTRLINRDLLSNPAKSESGVRRWLTFIILFLTAGTLIGDLIAFLSSLFDGELTMRFVLKVLTVLLIAGGIFLYYLWDMRRRVVVSRVDAPAV